MSKALLLKAFGSSDMGTIIKILLEQPQLNLSKGDKLSAMEVVTQEVAIYINARSLSLSFLPLPVSAIRDLLSALPFQPTLKLPSEVQAKKCLKKLELQGALYQAYPYPLQTVRHCQSLLESSPPQDTDPLSSTSLFAGCTEADQLSLVRYFCFPNSQLSSTPDWETNLELSKLLYQFGMRVKYPQTLFQRTLNVVALNFGRYPPNLHLPSQIYNQIQVRISSLHFIQKMDSLFVGRLKGGLVARLWLQTTYIPTFSEKESIRLFGLALDGLGYDSLNGIFWAFGKMWRLGGVIELVERKVCDMLARHGGLEGSEGSLLRRIIEMGHTTDPSKFQNLKKLLSS